MPLYEYQCKKCGHRFEEIQKFSDKPLTKCPKCRKGRLEKLLSAPAVQFKGSGWYVTDYGKGGGGGASKDKGDTSDKGGKESAKDAGKGEPKGDAKGAKKSSAKD